MEALSRQIKQVKDLRESEYGRIVEFNEEKALIERMAWVSSHAFYRNGDTNGTLKLGLLEKKSTASYISFILILNAVI